MTDFLKPLSFIQYQELKYFSDSFANNELFINLIPFIWCSLEARKPLKFQVTYHSNDLKSNTSVAYPGVELDYSLSLEAMELNVFKKYSTRLGFFYY